VRSGKSGHAEALLAEHESVTYVAPGPRYDDADWAARIARHRERRPETWRTLESSDLAGALAESGPVIVDCVGTWLTALLDAAALWDAPTPAGESHLADHLDAAVAALATRRRTTVLVTNEVGLGVVPEHRSGRLFRDLLGTANQRLAAACDEVHLVVAGRVLKLG
jgi:adenosylcobinamide kinase/adenosylcobinamide-phosphate guanylyltransferase